MKEKWKLALPAVLMLVFAATRWPGLMPPNFSAAYAIAFCAGVYFPRKTGWWLPMVTLILTDLAIDFYYQLAFQIDAFQWPQLFNYVAYAAIIFLGQRFRPRASLLNLLAGGLMGAVLFYLITNTASWFFNPFHHPEYTKTFEGWLIALTRGTAGYPETWEFFRNTLLSGGLFTGLFSAAMKGAESAKEPAEEEDQTEPEDAEPEAESSKA